MRHFLPIAIVALFAASGCQTQAGSVDIGDASAVHLVRVSGTSGRVSLTGNPDVNEIRGTLTSGGIGAQQAPVTVLHPDGILDITYPCIRLLPCTTDAVLTVPAHLQVDVALGSGSIEVVGVQAANLHLDAGEVQATVDHTLHVAIGTGILRGRVQAGGQVHATVASGDVELAVPQGGWQIETVAHRLRMVGVALDPHAPGRLSVHAAAGTVDIAGLDEVASR